MKANKTTRRWEASNHRTNNQKVVDSIAHNQILKEQKQQRNPRTK
jgi:hypothetical protein